MGIFGTQSPFDQYVERATSEKNTNEDWGQIMDICDRVKESATGPKDCLKSIVKRLNSENPRIVLQNITLLDACINNCGRKFLLEVASREFEQELRKILTSTRTHHKVSERLRESLKKWTEGEFKGDPQLSLIPSLYGKLKQEGYDFSITSDSPKKTVKYSTDPNVVNNKQEEDDIARAIQLSLTGEGRGGPTGGGGGLYASASAALASDGPMTGGGLGPMTDSPDKDQKKARALYDFEAAEDNELTFKAGEIVVITDNSDPNWWKGNNHRGEGLFPANFVTLDLNVPNESSTQSGNKRVSFSECVEVTEVENVIGGGEVSGEVDEEKIDQLLHVLHEADPTGMRPDDPTLAHLEECVNAMAPTIDSELEKIDRTHAELARLSTELVGGLNLYHQLMREMPPMGYFGMGGKGPVAVPGQMPPGFGPPGPPGMPQHQAWRSTDHEVTVATLPDMGFVDSNVDHQMYGNGGQFMPYMGGPPGAGGPINYGGLPPPGHGGMPPQQMPPHMQHHPNAATQPPNVGGPGPVNGQPGPVTGHPPLPGQPAPMPHMDHTQNSQQNVDHMGNFSPFPLPGGAQFTPVGPQHNGRLPPQHQQPLEHPPSYNHAAFNQQQPMHQPIL